MLRDRTDLAGRRALLTGAGGGLGRTIAVALAEQGVDLVLTDRPGTDLSGLSRDLGSRGVRVATLDADLTDRAAASDLVRRAEEALGPLDILINNAGIEFVAPWHDRTPENLAFEVDLNLVAPMLLTHAVLPGMVERGRGHVLTISSIGGMMAIPYLIGYAASKHGIAAFNRALAAEVGDKGIAITTVFPGLIRDAGMGANYTGALTPGVLERVATRTPAAVGRAVVRGLRTGRNEVVVSATPTRPIAVLTAIRPSASIRLMQRILRWGAPRVDAHLAEARSRADGQQ
ncbi:SDR family NAD(P)-dependent oxidoreductase [Dietzia sp. UBA5065]|uniref:SDR family NAD(P)-dependent oxidoreductase n=1 Tax=Dietzia sp. UBA5065 TaxID=1946422 RepID=UPI0025C39B02|nr:SDR family NAD(P)-dependent oxidoreductase [Dietzia sp. UBA5065]